MGENEGAGLVFYYLRLFYFLLLTDYVRCTTAAPLGRTRYFDEQNCRWRGRLFGALENGWRARNLDARWPPRYEGAELPLTDPLQRLVHLSGRYKGEGLGESCPLPRYWEVPSTA